MSDALMDMPIVVLLGASNVTRSIGSVVDIAQHRIGGPARYYIACGHGRSYGATSCAVWRYLPGIVPCEMWGDLDLAIEKSIADGKQPRVYALLTDIGNDIVYGFDTDAIAGWINTCIDRLSQYDAQILMTRLPKANVDRLSQRKFNLFKRLLFRCSKMTLDDVVHRTHIIDQVVASFGARDDVHVVEQDAKWYGFDPIHLRMRHVRPAYKHILSHWPMDEPPTDQRVPRAWGRWLYLRSRTPRERYWCGIRQKREQPSARLRDGSVVGMY